MVLITPQAFMSYSKLRTTATSKLGIAPLYLRTKTK